MQPKRRKMIICQIVNNFSCIICNVSELSITTEPRIGSESSVPDEFEQNKRLQFICSNCWPDTSVNFNLMKSPPVQRLLQGHETTQIHTLNGICCGNNSTQDTEQFDTETNQEPSCRSISDNHQFHDETNDSSSKQSSIHSYCTRPSKYTKRNKIIFRHRINHHSWRI